MKRRIIKTYVSSTGSTIHTHTFYGHVTQTPHIKSYAALRLLQCYYHVRDKDFLEDNFMTRINFSRDYLSGQLKIHGNLTCKYCGKTDLKIEFANMNIPKAIKATIDHVIPISKGGKVYDIENLVVACSRCNSNKGNLMPEEFVEILSKRQAKKNQQKQKQLSSILV